MTVFLPMNRNCFCLRFGVFSFIFGFDGGWLFEDQTVSESYTVLHEIWRLGFQETDLNLTLNNCYSDITPSSRSTKPLRSASPKMEVTHFSHYFSKLPESLNK